MATQHQHQQHQHQRKMELEEEEEQQQQQQQQEVSLSVCSDTAGVDVDVDVDADADADNSTSKAARLPRWTRQEILVLIQGKKVAENRVRRGRAAVSSVEPKWATVSSYCKRHGVNRGAVQCRKRWSNLAGDFKKIKEWESHIQDDSDSDSFWLMRNDIRREHKLPGFFDREVYDILDNKKDPSPPPPPLLFDSGRNAPPDDALFSDLDDKQQFPLPLSLSTPFAAPTPISAKQYQPHIPDAIPTPTPTPTGVDDDKQAASNPEIGSTSQGERKRKRLLVEDETGGGGAAASLLQVMEKNGKILNAQLEAHNINLKLDREDRKDHANSMVAVLNKLADALARIADKL